MNNPQPINLFEKIQGVISAADKTTGQPIPTAVISNSGFQLSDASVGQITQDPNDATKFEFTPTAPGQTDLIVSAQVSIP